MKGFLKIPSIDFESWNAIATADYIESTGDDTCMSYTASTEDTDPAFVWARIEHDFVEGDVKTHEEAINLGMVVLEDE